MAAKRAQLEADNAEYESWSDRTAVEREGAAKAQAELERRGHGQQPEDERQAQPGEHQTMAEWWQQFEADFAAVDRAIEREHQAAVAANRPWPPEKTAQAEGSHDEARAAIERLQRDGYLRMPDPEPKASEPEPDEPVTDVPGPQPESGSSANRLDQLQARASEAAQQIAAEREDLARSSEYQARIEREAQAAPEAHAQAEYDGIEL